jgi:MoaA/NifB/PqqE/SkfB family radical SAM enzyme
MGSEISGKVENPSLFSSFKAVVFPADSPPVKTTFFISILDAVINLILGIVFMHRAIPVLDINITNNCNYCCEYCYTSTYNSKNITVETFTKFLELAKSLGAKYIEFCGGEPLLHPELEKLVKLAKQKKFKLILRTNGIFLNQHIPLIANNFEWVGISLDGLPETNDLMRKSKSALSALDKFSLPLNAFFQLKKENPKIKLVLATLVSSANYLGLKEFEKYLLEKSVPLSTWKLYRFIPSNYRALKNKDNFYLSKNNFNKICGEINSVQLKKELGAKTIFCAGEDTGGPCVFVSTDGDVWIGAANLVNINKQTIPQIKECLFKRKEVKNVLKNKKETYLS